MAKTRFWGRGDTPPGQAGGHPVGGSDAAAALQLMRNFEESCQGWFWSTDADGRLIYLSDGIARQLGLAPDQIAGARFADLFFPADQDANGKGTLPFVLAKHRTFEKLTLCAALPGDERAWSVSGSPQFDSAGNFDGYRGSGVDITAQRMSSRQASLLAKYDSLTGLPNRLSMTQVLEASLRASTGARRSCAVMMIDLDRFKQVNDTLGHPAGDELLKQVAERLLTIVGDREKVFRPGGDEFQIVMCGCDDRGVLGDMATRIITSLSQPYSVDGSRCIIGASIGIAIGPTDGDSSDILIRNADLALYAAKSGGRGRFRFFATNLLDAAKDRRVLEEDLRDALARGEMRVAYQPIVCLHSNNVSGVEALLRWEHPERGSISPALFIPIAEETDLIGPLGEWVLRKACEDAATWPGKLRVAVNVSPIQFVNEALPGIILSALASSGLAPDRLELEITEGVFLGEAAETDTMFTALKSIGVRLALDDFGTGYSSLGYLRSAPFDKIKIDQTFVRAATLPGSRNSAIIAAIVALARALDMETTAEGIEFMDQLQLIRGLGVSHVQGFVYSKAVDNSEMNRRLTVGDWVIEPAGPARQRSDRLKMYRNVGVIHGSRYENALVRNLSESGALIEGLEPLDVDTLILLDFGDGQIAFARVTRSIGRQLGIQFHEPLVNDGDGGLCTSHRVAPYLLETIGLPTPAGSGGGADNGEASAPPLQLEEFANRLGMSLAPVPSSAATAAGAAAAMLSWRVPGAGAASQVEASRRLERDAGLTPDDVQRLIEACLVSQNRQLKYIVSLLILTGVRQGELVKAQWSHIDLDEALWRIPVSKEGRTRDLPLSPDAVGLLRELPRWPGCPYLIANPTTKKPYRAFGGSWEAARAKAGLPNVEVDELRFCDDAAIASLGRLLELARQGHDAEADELFLESGAEGEPVDAESDDMADASEIESGEESLGPDSDEPELDAERDEQAPEADTLIRSDPADEHAPRADAGMSGDEAYDEPPHPSGPFSSIFRAA